MPAKKLLLLGILRAYNQNTIHVLTKFLKISYAIASQYLSMKQYITKTFPSFFTGVWIFTRY